MFTQGQLVEIPEVNTSIEVLHGPEMDHVTIHDRKFVLGGKPAELIMPLTEASRFYAEVNLKRRFWEGDEFSRFAGVTLKAESNSSEEDGQVMLCARVRRGSLYLYYCLDPRFVPQRQSVIVLNGSLELDDLLRKFAGNPWIDHYIELE